MAKSAFEGMAECQFCGSGTFEPMQIIIVGVVSGTYCKTCWKDFGFQQPVDNFEDTPK